MDAIKDWREIDTSTKAGLKALDRVIAQRLGFQGECVNCCWATDADEALELWDRVHVIFTPRLVRLYAGSGELGMVAVYKAVILANATHEEYEAVESTPALAICKCWLAWHDEYRREN